MADATTIWDQQNANTNALVQALTQFFSDPSRLAELSSVPQAVADQAYSATNQQFAQAGRNTGFDLASRGLQGSSTEQEQLGQLRSAYNQNVAGIEAQRQGQVAQNQNSFLQQYMASLQNAYQSNPLTQAALQANLQGIGSNTSAAQTNASLAQQMQQIQQAYANNMSNALATPLNIYAARLSSGA